MRVGGPGLADLDLVGSPLENDLAFPDWEVGDVGVAPREECGLECAGVAKIGFHGVTDGINHILVGKPHRSLNPRAQPQDFFPRWQ